MLTLPSGAFLILGHRGASAHAPENSLEAFRLAAAQGADGVELDVRRTADGVLVIHHDAIVEGVGPIIELTAAALGRRAPSIPTFEQAMASCAGMIVNLEIKNSPLDPDFDPTDEVAGQVVDWVESNEWGDRVIVSSFNPSTIDRVRQLTGRIATGQLIDPGSDPARLLLAAHQRGHQALHPHVSSLADASGLATIATGLGMWLLAWTVDDPGAVRALQRAGLTGVITNDPERAAAGLD